MIQDANAARQAAEEHHAEDFVTALEKASEDVRELEAVEAPPEVRYVTIDGETVFDEVVAQNAYVHLECMDDNHWWMIITSGGQSVRVNLYTKRAKIITDVEVEDE